MPGRYSHCANPECDKPSYRYPKENVICQQNPKWSLGEYQRPVKSNVQKLFAIKVICEVLFILNECVFSLNHMLAGARAPKSSSNANPCRFFPFINLVYRNPFCAWDVLL